MTDGTITIGSIGGNVSGNVATGNITITAPPDPPEMTTEIAKLTDDLKKLLEQQRDPHTAADLWRKIKSSAPAVADWFIKFYRQPITTLLTGIDDLLS